MGLPRGVFLCHRRTANASRRLSSGVFRLCFCFSAVVIRLSDKCRLKSTLSGFSTFADGRLPSDSQTFGDSRGATLTPTLRLSDSHSLTDSQRLSDYQRLSTFDFRPAGGGAPVRRPPHDTTRRDPARNTGTPRGRHYSPRRGRNNTARCGGTPRRLARQKHAQTPHLYIARK